MSDWCTVDNGTVVGVYEFIRKLFEALYWALKATEFTLKLIGKVLFLIFPSGVKVKLFDSIIPDFRLPEKKFWAIQFSLLNLITVNIPLPKKPIHEVWREFVAPFDFYIEGSENVFYFKDPLDDEYRLGADCTPVQKYGVLGNGLVDTLHIIKIYLIARVLVKLGLFKTAGKFLQWFFQNAQTWMLRRNVSDTLETIEDVKDGLDLIDEELDELGVKLDGIDSKIGLRMVFR